MLRISSIDDVWGIGFAMTNEEYAVGDIVNDHVLIGEQWVPAVVRDPDDAPSYEPGHIVNGHAWTGEEWIVVRTRKAPKKPSLQKRWEAKVDSWKELAEKEEQERQEKSPHFAQCGRMVAEGVVAGRRVKIYEKGFVQVGMFSLGDPEKLLGITAQDSSQQKSALGRTLAAGVTLGANLITSPSKRGSLYLIIVTSKKTHSLTLSPPTDSDLKAMHKLEAAGRSVLAALETQKQVEATTSASGSATASLSEQLAQLSELHQAGALTDEEFSAAKARLLAGDAG
jgi:hypothetical protein